VYRVNFRVLQRGLVAGAVALVFASGCSAGQITGTDTTKSVVPGGSAATPFPTPTGGEVGVRNAYVEYPGLSGYAAGGQAPISVRVFNSSGTTIRLTGVTSDAGKVALFNAAAPPVASVTPSASAAPAAGAPINLELLSGSFLALDPNLEQYLVVTGLNKPLKPGESIELKFQFSTGTEVSVNAPVTPPGSPAPRSTG
jgi:copper(I)-binding protein